jgi:diguanylate cyclase (GGDEF)-like protein
MTVTENLKRATINLLYGQSIRIALSHILASALFVVWLKDLVLVSSLVIWFCSILFLCSTRIALYFIYKKYQSQAKFNSIWLHVWAAISVLLGASYSVAFIEFIPLDKPEYVISVAGFVIAFASSAMITYGGSIYGVLSFIVPLSLPSVIHFSVYGGYYGLMSSAAIAIYGLIIFSLLKSSFTSFKKSTTLNYQLQKEIDKRSLVEKQLQEISRRDSLTGMFNRRYFDEMLSVEIGRASRNHSPLCLLMFDVDCFKEYNDKYGHVAGDNCLIKIADIVEKLTSRKGDLIARYGGEEFAVILPNIELTGAVAFAKKLQEGVQKHKIEHLSSKLTTLKCVTISVGVTHLMPFTKMTANQIIEAADNALYEAKRDGRNRVHHHQNRSFDAGLS